MTFDGFTKKNFAFLFVKQSIGIGMVITKFYLFRRRLEPTFTLESTSDTVVASPSSIVVFYGQTGDERHAS